MTAAPCTLAQPIVYSFAWSVTGLSASQLARLVTNQRSLTIPANVLQVRLSLSSVLFNDLHVGWRDVHSESARVVGSNNRLSHLFLLLHRRPISAGCLHCEPVVHCVTDLSIQAGGDRSIPANQALTLDASQSFDPDNRTSVPSFSWSCVASAGCSPSLWNAASNRAQLGIPAGSLTAKQQYVFTVTLAQGALYD